MNSFRLNVDTIFVIDITGISIVNKKNYSQTFIAYPEAAVWAVLTEKYHMSKSIQMVMAILDKPESETISFIHNCLKEWKKLNILH
jgi:hypothetical protein